jgi:hypothetical protein
MGDLSELTVLDLFCENGFQVKCRQNPRCDDVPATCRHCFPGTRRHHSWHPQMCLFHGYSQRLCVSCAKVACVKFCSNKYNWPRNVCEFFFSNLESTLLLGRVFPALRFRSYNSISKSHPRQVFLAVLRDCCKDICSNWSGNQFLYFLLFRFINRIICKAPRNSSLSIISLYYIYFKQYRENSSTQYFVN